MTKQPLEIVTCTLNELKIRDLTARIDEIKKARDRKQIFGYYDDRIAELEKQLAELS